MKNDDAYINMTPAQLLQSQVISALEILKDAPRNVLVPEMVKFMVAIDLAANGPVNTLLALDGIREQVAGIFPKSATIVEKMNDVVAGTA